MALLAASGFLVVGCVDETASPKSDGSVVETSEAATNPASTSATANATTLTTLSLTTTSTATAPPTTATSTTATSTTVTSTSLSESTSTIGTSGATGEAATGYSTWDTFWPVFSKAAATGDVATVGLLTADQLTFAYAGGSVSTSTGPKEDFLQTFVRPQETFEEGRGALSDGTVFSAELRSPGEWSLLHQVGVPYDIGYSVLIEEGPGGPPSASEYIFRKVNGTFLLVGYSVDS